MIREIVENDRENIKTLLDYFPKDIVENLITELDQAIAKNIQGYVYESKDDILGYISLRKWGGVYWLDTVVVDSNRRRKGIGKELVKFAKEKCIKDNVPQLNTCTFEKSNIHFYKNLGFIFMGELEGPFISLDKKRFYLKWLNN